MPTRSTEGQFNRLIIVRRPGTRNGLHDDSSNHFRLVSWDSQLNRDGPTDRLVSAALSRYQTTKSTLGGFSPCEG